MNGKIRFIKTMRYEQSDRPPLFEDGIREECTSNLAKPGIG